MKRVLTCAVLMTLVLAGCGKKALKERVVGKWKSSIEIDQAKLDEMLKDAPDEIKEKAKKSMGDMQLEIEMKDDGSYITTMSGGPDDETDTKEGTWEVESAEGEVLKLKITEGKKDKTSTITLTFKGNDEFGFTTDEKGFEEAPFKTPIKFTRVK